MSTGIASSKDQSEIGDPRSDEPQPDPRRWQALGVLGLIQFMLILDLTVVNVALPQIQTDLGFSTAGLVWVVNGYALMAGGLLLLGGRLADVFGRRRVFLIGVGVFAVASAVCGVAAGPAILISGRFVQGIGEALAAPASLGLVVLLFPDPRERIKAIGIWGGLTGLGGVSGTVISGALTDLASWRWIFLVNLPIALIALIAVPRLVTESRMVREHHRLDFTGAITATFGLVTIVFGLLQAHAHPWGSWQVLLPLLAGVVLLAATVAIEARSATPLIPMRFFTNRTRLVANVITLFNMSALFAYSFLLTLFLQRVLDFTPLQAGLSYLPLGIGIGIGVGLGTALMPRLGVKPLLASGCLGSAIGVLMTSWIVADSSYAGGVLPGMIVLGLFNGLTFPTTVNAALHGASSQDSGLASGVQSTMQQVGGALGLAVLATLALRHEMGQIRQGVFPDVAATDGYALSLRIAAALFAVSAALVVLLLQRVTTQPRDPAVELSPDRG